MRNSKGDTIVEVMLAIALLSAILFTSWSIVNKSTRIGLAARQRVNVVSQMREQAEIIQSQQSSLKTTVIQGLTASDAASLTANACVDAQLSTASPVDNLQRFHYTVNDTTGALQSQPGKYETFDQFGNRARVWVQFVPVPNATTPEYIDFYVRGCWYTAGGGQNEDTSQFILRLNV